MSNLVYYTSLYAANQFHILSSKVKKSLTKQQVTAHNVLALAKSSVSDWRRYVIFVVTQARHFQSVLFLCLNSPQFMVGCVWGFMPATPTSGTPTRTVCLPYWRKGGKFLLIRGGRNHA